MENTHPSQSPFLRLLSGLGKLYVIVAAVIGSLVFLAGVGIFLIIKNGAVEPSSTQLNKKVVHEGTKDEVAIVEITGVITEDASGGGFGANDGASSKQLIRVMDELGKKSEVKAVLLRINSPGGAVVASDEVYRAVLRLKKQKPVIASMGDTAASGGYYIAAAADKIVANPATITGSIGVIAQLPQVSGLYDKLGIKMRTFKSGKFKDIGSESRDISPEESEIFNGLIMGSYDQFVQAISTGRKMDEAKVRQLADGRIYTGQQAKDNGLVDELGDIASAVSLAEQSANINDATLVEYSNQGFLESLFSSKISPLQEFTALQKLLPNESFGMYYLLEI